MLINNTTRESRSLLLEQWHTQSQNTQEQIKQAFQRNISTLKSGRIPEQWPDVSGLPDAVKTDELDRELLSLIKPVGMWGLVDKKSVEALAKHLQGR